MPQKKKENNIYAICTKSVGRTNEKKYKKCKMEVQKNIGNPVTENQVREVTEHRSKLGVGLEKKDIQKIADKFSLPYELTEKITYLYQFKNKTPHEIWEEIELEEAIKKLPGRETRIKLFKEGIAGNHKITKIEKASKLTPLYKMFFEEGVNTTITKKELISLWTEGKTPFIKLIPEKEGLEGVADFLGKQEEKLKKLLTNGKINIEVEDNEFSRIFKELIKENYKKENISESKYNSLLSRYEKYIDDETIKADKDFQFLNLFAKHLTSKK